MTDTIRWRKSTCSNSTSSCVELAPEGLVRDSKNPHGPILKIRWDGLIVAIQNGTIS
ncbi:MAG TPA: DUF397 domain-containing protein [Pseudonocardiaceae bacterium]|nr:DUF397 domain-containing protein [Pseudonocardiaceae bacterium]